VEKERQRELIQTDVVEKERQREFDYRLMLWIKKGKESLITDRCSGERKAERV
jgi:hypothetical protein